MPRALRVAMAVPSPVETETHRAGSTGQAMRTRIRRAFIGLGVALVSVPVGFMLTLFLVPFWAWLEATTGIESVGH